MLPTQGRIGRALPLLVLAAIALTACGSEESPDAEQTPAAGSSPAGLSDADLEAYFAAVASYDPDLLAAARESTEPGSNADHYAGYLIDFTTAAIEGDRPIASADVEPVDGGFKACGGTGDPTSCVTWADLEVVDGALVDFTIDGESLDDRLVAGDGSTIPANDLGTVEFLYAYLSPQSGTQFVLARVTAGDEPVGIGGHQATYLSADGTTLQSAGAWGLGQVEPGTEATVVLPFENATASGVATVSLFRRGDPHGVPVELDTAS
jgi:hypothetical protein